MHFFTESNNARIQSINHRAFNQIHRDWLQGKQSLNLADDEIPKFSGNSSVDSWSQVCSSRSASSNAVKSSQSHGRGLFGSLGRKTPRRDGNKDIDATGQWKEVHYGALSSVEEVSDVFSLENILTNAHFQMQHAIIWYLSDSTILQH